MPVTAKTSSTLAKLGDISTFDVSTSAVPVDTADSSGSVPTLSATFADGTDTEYLSGETLTVSAPSIDSFSGRVVSHSKSGSSNRYSVNAESILARLNSEIRTYPFPDYNGAEYPALVLYSLEYWTQQCGIFFTKVEGDVLFYQSAYGHFAAFAKDYTRPLRSTRTPGMTGSLYGRYDRVWTGFGHDFDAEVNFPEGNYLGLPIPKASETDRLVFGIDVDLTGTGRTADVTWQLRRYNNTKPAIRISVDSEEGFRLKSADSPGAFGTRITSVVPKGQVYSVYASVRQASATDTEFTLTVFNAAGVLVDSQTVTNSSLIRGNPALTSVRYHGYTGGSGDELVYGNSFISRMKSVPTKKFADGKELTGGPKGAAFMVGFSGNAWEHIKQYCSIYHLDVSYRDGKLVFGPRQRDVTVGATLSELSTTIQDREQARNVEVVNQNHKATGVTPTVMWAADSVYQVAVGEVQEFKVQTPHSIIETYQPVCVSGINPYPYKTGAGQYVVTGSDGYIVSPSFWADQGGSITTDITDVEGEIKITIKGPDFDSARAPYRISEGDAGRPALYVTGLGILAKPETLKVGTGKGKAAKDVGVTVDSPFISNAKLAYDAAARASKTFATPDVSTTIAEPLAYDGVSNLGVYPAGAIVKLNGNIMRVVSASQGFSKLSGNANQHNTIYQLKRSFTGMTIGQQKAFYAGKTIGQVNIKPLKRVV